MHFFCILFDNYKSDTKNILGEAKNENFKY